MATGVKETVTNRIRGEQFTKVLLFGAVVLVAVLAIAFLVSAPAHSVARGDPAQRAVEADAARWTAMGEYYAAQAQAEQRAMEAYQARSEGLAAHFAAQGTASQRAMDAYAARLTGQAEHYLGAR